MNLISKLKTLLHVGCASLNISHIKGFIIDDWTEIRFDIDESRNPDIVGTLTDMSLVQTESVDAIYSAYNIDHIYPHEVPTALSEFFRVLKDDGMAIIKCPDIQSVCEAVAKGNEFITKRTSYGVINNFILNNYNFNDYLISGGILYHIKKNIYANLQYNWWGKTFKNSPNSNFNYNRFLFILSVKL